METYEVVVRLPSGQTVTFTVQADTQWQAQAQAEGMYGGSGARVLQCYAKTSSAW